MQHTGTGNDFSTPTGQNGAPSAVETQPVPARSRTESAAQDQRVSVLDAAADRNL